MLAPFGYVYRTTNLVNGKTYIGLRYYRSDTGKDWLNYLGSGILIKQAVELYGRDNFTKEKLDEASDRDSLQELEWQWIQEEKLANRAEYNLFTGRGAGGDTFSALRDQTMDEVKKKMSDGIRSSEKMKKARIRQKKELEMRRESEYLIHKDRIIASFKVSQSVAKTASELSLSSKTVKRILDQAGVRLNHQNVEGSKQSEERRRAIQRGLLSTPNHKTGETPLELHNRLISQVEEIIESRQTLNRATLEQKFQVSHGSMNRFLTIHEITKKADRLWTTGSCVHCALSFDL